MAKRQDRNVVALAKARAQGTSNIFVTDDGREIELKKPDMMFVQQASSSVIFPDKPTYTVKIGKTTREYPLDEVVIEQTEDPLEKKKLSLKYNKYLMELGTAYNEQTLRSTGALFYEGTVAQEEIDDPKWEKKMRISRWPIPKDPEERWVFYLQTSLSEDEIARLSAQVVRLIGGVPEEKIKAAEDMFRVGVQTDEGAGDLEDSEPDEGGN